jgi:hypothetical protein
MSQNLVKGKTMKRFDLMWLGSAALMLMLAAPAFAQDSLFTCDGGAQEAVVTRMETAGPFTLIGAGVVPNTLVAGGASGVSDQDVYTVTFSAQTRHTSGGTLSMRAQFRVGPTGSFANMPPGVVKFHTGAEAETHTMTWCVQTEAATNISFRIVYSEAPGGGAGQIDNYTMRVERSE